MGLKFKYQKVNGRIRIEDRTASPSPCGQPSWYSFADPDEPLMDDIYGKLCREGETFSAIERDQLRCVIDSYWHLTGHPVGSSRGLLRQLSEIIAVVREERRQQRRQQREREDN